ncbi:MAG: hypothetical protein NTX50_07665 [Candidatus Sumerlaeota bacterium]|nr:hypothetical protein [Candidatus Sumerlaeota bacterium]
MSPNYWDILFKELKAVIHNWQAIPPDFWRILWPLALIIISSYPLVICWSVIRREMRSRLDRWMLAPVFGLAWYTLLFVALNAIFRIPIGQISFYIICALTCAGGYGWLWMKLTKDRGQGAKRWGQGSGVRGQGTGDRGEGRGERGDAETEGRGQGSGVRDQVADNLSQNPESRIPIPDSRIPNPESRIPIPDPRIPNSELGTRNSELRSLRSAEWWGEWRHADWLVLAGWLLLWVIIGGHWFTETLKYSDQLLDSDPYRHHPRTEWIVRTGDLNRWEPWLTGHVPIYEFQGCYVIAAQLSTVAHVDSWTLWKYGSVLMGIFSGMTMFLLGAYFIPGRRRPFAGLLSIAALVTFSAFYSRTNMDFSEPWGLVYIPVAILMLVWAFRFHSAGAGALYGILFLAVAASNMVPNFMLMVFLTPYCGYQILRRFTWDCWLARRQSKAQAKRMAEAMAEAEAKTSPPEAGVEGRLEAAPLQPDSAAAKPLSNAWTEWKRRQWRVFGGLGAGVAIFMAFMLIWNYTYAGIPLSKGAKAHSISTEEGLKKGREQDENKAAKKPPLQGLPALMEKIAGGRESLDTINDYLRRFNDWEKAQAGQNAYYRCPNDDWIASAGLSKDFALGALITLVVILLPAGGASRQANGAPMLSAAPRGFFARWLWPNGGPSPQQWSDARIFLLCFLLFPLLNYIMLPRKIFGHELPTYTEKTYRYLLTPAYCLALSMALMADVARDFFTDMFRRLWRAAHGEESQPGAPKKQTEPRTERRAQARRSRRSGKTVASQPRAKIEAQTSASDSAPEETPTPWSMLLKWLLRLAPESYFRLFLTACAGLIAFHALAFVAPYGNWPPTTTKAEVKALKWICDNLPSDAIIFCNWFDADFVRSYTAHAGKPMYSIFAGAANADGSCAGIRSNIRFAKKMHDLEIPGMTSLGDILKYIRGKPGNYYIMNTKWGRHFQATGDTLVRLISFTASSDKDTDTVTIWGLKNNPWRIEASSAPQPIAGSEVGAVINLDSLDDGSLGQNRDSDAARVDPIQKRPHWVWFGLKCVKPRAFRSASAYLAMYKNAAELLPRNGRPRSPLTYCATEYVFQYWNGKDWVDIPGTHVKNNKEPEATAQFDPIETDQIRVYCFGQRNDDGDASPRGLFRGACLEFSAK